MSGHSIEKNQLDEVSFYEKQMLSIELQEKESYLQEAAGLTLDQIFNQDVLNQVSKESSSQVMEEVLIPSFWNKILSWWKEAENIPASQVFLKESQEGLDSLTPKPMSSIPVLEAPDHIPEDLEVTHFPSSKQTTNKSKLTLSEIEEGLALMSEKTIESIMLIVFKAQIELEKEKAHIAEGTFSKYMEFQKLQMKLLQEIKDALASDQQVAGYFKTAQSFTMIAGFITGLVAAAISLGIFNMIKEVIHRTGHPVGKIFLLVATFIGTVGPFATAGLTAITLGTKAYFQRRFNEDKAKHEEYSHQDKYYNECVDNSRNHLMKIADADNVFKEHWIRLLKRCDKMRRIVLRK